MTPTPDHQEFPFAVLLRSSDRERLLVQLMASVWETILQLPLLVREAHDDDRNWSAGVPPVTGRIRIAGAWEGTVALTGPRSFAAKCAAIMYQREPESLTDAGVRDAWGELTNMVGGNLKALVPPVSRLGLPTVHEDESLAAEDGGARVLNDVIFACRGQRVRLTVTQARR
jgi:chemotaxis protein CheX